MAPKQTPMTWPGAQAPLADDELATGDRVDDRDRATGHRPPERCPVSGGAQRRAADVALAMGLSVRRLVEQEVLGTGLTMDREPGPPGLGHQVGAAGGAQVHEAGGAAGLL